MPVIPGLRRLRKKNPEFEARLRYIERSCLKKKKERKKERNRRKNKNTHTIPKEIISMNCIFKAHHFIMLKVQKHRKLFLPSFPCLSFCFSFAFGVCACVYGGRGAQGFMHCYTIPSVEQQEILTSYPLFRTKIQWIQ
jgi:hypothetical protein